MIETIEAAEGTKTGGTLGEAIETEMTDTVATKTLEITIDQGPAGTTTAIVETTTAIAETMVQATGGEAAEMIGMTTTPPDARVAAIDESPIAIATATKDQLGETAKEIVMTGILQGEMTKETINVMIKLRQGNS